MGQLKNKITIITGASSGIGKACAEVFAKEKSNLILAARRIERIQIFRNKIRKAVWDKNKVLQARRS